MSMTPPRYLVLDVELERATSWSRQTFPHATEASTLEHLRREMAEFSADPSVYEAADVLILLAQWAHITGVDLAWAVHDKMRVNVNRHWGVPDAYGVVEHVRSVTDGNINDPW